VAGTLGSLPPAAAFVNGKPAGSIDLQDRGLAYGDGLFETIAMRCGGPCLWPEHMARLSAGAERLGIPMPGEALWRDEIRQLTRAGPTATVKLILTRGIGARGYRPPLRPQPSRILLLYPTEDPAPRWSRREVAVRLCTTRLGANPALAGIKHLNRLEQVMAQSEWTDPDIAEGLMCDVHGNLIGGTMTNLFLYREGTLLTPRLHQAGVSGTVRRRVLYQARALGIPVRETRLRPADLLRADGAFLTNALIGCRPISRFDGHPLDESAVPPALLERVQHDAFEPDPDR
jgi:4-amino-4-deoxychorismate lyase